MTDIMENDLWNTYTVGEPWKRLRDRIVRERLRKNSVWELGILKMLGYSEEFLKKAHLGAVPAKEINGKFYQAAVQYYIRLMNNKT